MSLQKIAELAEEFAIKIAEYKYENEAPQDVKSADIGWLDDNSAIDEKTWSRAKKVVKKYWKKYDEPWAVVYDVYRRMGGGTKKTKKKSK